MKEIRKDLIIDTDKITQAKIEAEISKTSHNRFLANPDFVFQAPGSLFIISKFLRGGDLMSILPKMFYRQIGKYPK